MKTTCLLIKLPDGRTFFTIKKNYTLLLEFAKIYGAQLKIVKAIDPQLLTLKDLATKICDQTIKSDISKKECTIRDHITKQFKSGKFVKIKEIGKDLNNVSASTLYRHINYVKHKLEKEGKIITKVSPGIYRMEIK
jgi:hypothetical protein